MKILTFQEAEKALDEFVPRPLLASRTYNLDVVRELACYVGDPQESLRVIHVAGTSGKTSTCYYIASLLQASGHSVGLSVSPQLVSMGDRVQINGVPMAEDVFCEDLGVFMEEVRASGLKPTYSEILMVFAYWEFVRHGVEYAVVEVWVGGTWDCSNIVARTDKVCVITDIGIDHTHLLGTTLSEIAYWKAGIIQRANPVFMHTQDEAAAGVIRARSREMQADLHVLPAEATPPSAAKDLPLYQQRNFALAAAAVEYALARDYHASLKQAAKSLAAGVYIPGRLEVMAVGGKTLVLDGAHNPQKLSVLRATLQDKFGHKPIAILASIMQSREGDVASIAAALTALGDDFIICTIKDDYHVSLDPVVLADACKESGVRSTTIIPDLAEALQELMSRPEEVLLVTGSLYLVAHVRRLLDARVTAP